MIVLDSARSSKGMISEAFERVVGSLLRQCKIHLLNYATKFSVDDIAKVL